MPIYDYHCEACNIDYKDVLRKSTRDEDRLMPCEKCGVVLRNLIGNYHITGEGLMGKFNKPGRTLV